MDNLSFGTYYMGIEDRYSGEVFQWWIYYGKPCNLLFMKAKTQGLVAIELTVNSYETNQFVMKIKERINCKLIQKKER